MSTSTMNIRIREAPQIPSFFDSLPVSFHAGFCGGINLFNFISTLFGALGPFRVKKSDCWKRLDRSMVCGPSSKAMR